MARLTEEMIIARSKQSDLTSIKKLNCWCVHHRRKLVIHPEIFQKKQNWAIKFLHRFTRSLS